MARSRRLGGPVAVTESNGKLMIGGATITTADIKASNGVIHVIDAVITKPATSDEASMPTVVLDLAQASEWKRPPKSSRLYATTTNAPKTTNGSSSSVQATAAATPIAVAAPIETQASAISTPSGIAVRSGRPLSSSSAWAPTPSARANAVSPQSNRLSDSSGARAAPITTYERCQSVYGGWSSVR